MSWMIRFVLPFLTYVLTILIEWDRQTDRHRFRPPIFWFLFEDEIRVTTCPSKNRRTCCHLPSLNIRSSVVNICNIIHWLCFIVILTETFKARWTLTPAVEDIKVGGLSHMYWHIKTSYRVEETIAGSTSRPFLSKQETSSSPTIFQVASISDIPFFSSDNIRIVARALLGKKSNIRPITSHLL